MRNTPDDFAILDRVFAYDPLTGLFTWKIAVRAGIGPGHPAGWIDIGRGYMKLRHARRDWYAHRAAWTLTYGTQPTGKIDHIDGVKTNNRSRICAT
jgi:hypothetical protein